MGLAAVTMHTSIVLGAALLVALACRHRSAALRHFVLAAGVGASLLTIPFAAVVPAWDVLPGVAPGFARMPVPAGTPLPSADLVRPAPSGRETTWSPSRETVPAGAGTWPFQTDPAALAALVWLVGVIIAGARIGAGLFRLRRLSARVTCVDDPSWLRMRDATAGALGVARPVTLLAGEHVAIGTWGVLRPRIALPADSAAWPDDRARVVLYHELAHVRRGDWGVQLAAETLRAIVWFNPLAWIVCRRLRDEAERACDDIVLGSGVRDDDYADHLLAVARATRGRAGAPAAAMSMARSSTLEGRIAAMLNSKLDRRTPSLRMRTVTLLSLVALASAAATLRVAAQDGPLAVRGAVYDSSGGVLPAVEMTLENDQGVKWSTPTDGQGRFEFAPVGSGHYQLEASIPGFRTLRQALSLERAGDWNRAITLQVGPLQETINVTARRPRNPAPAAATPADVPRVRVGGNIKVPRKVRHVAPVYPESMREAGLEGVVPLEAIVGPDGTVGSVRVLSAQVHPEFAAAAAAAVRQWVFTPTLLNGTAVEVSITVSVQFSLSD